MKKHVIGIDYGTESARAVLVEVTSGREIASFVYKYSGGVIDQYLPETKIKLEANWALQNPLDYFEALYATIPGVMRQAGITSGSVIGIGVDFTASTILPIDQEGQPLCFNKKYKNNPHSWVKLWKHHAAQEEADLLNKLAEKSKQAFPQRYGGKISSEWLFPKVWQILNEAPEIYEAADRFIEAGDWIVLMLTGKEARSSCMAGYKGLWHKKEGYPSREFLKSLDPRLETLATEKLSTDIKSVGTKASRLTKSMARAIGLEPGTAVAVANIDAHAAVPAMGVTEPGKMVMIMGTSLCHMLLSDKEVNVPGISGVVEDGIIPGLYGYEAGQAAAGDIFSWFMENGIPRDYMVEAEQCGKDVYRLLEEKATRLEPGETGLLALDWWNGNRSTLVNSDLSGLILGYSLRTKPEEIYRTLLEATAFGTNLIIRNFVDHGVAIKELYACGGLSEKNHLLLQIFADVTNMEIKRAKVKFASGFGAAMMGAVAAGKQQGGYDSLFEAASQMVTLYDEVIKPIPENVKVYRELYEEYEKLYYYFGNKEQGTMKKLKGLMKKTTT